MTLKSVDQRLDAVYAWADRLMREGRREELDRVLGRLRSTEVDILYAFLVATLPYRKRLTAGRQRIYAMLQAIEPNAGILEGIL